MTDRASDPHCIQSIALKETSETDDRIESQQGNRRRRIVEVNLALFQLIDQRLR